ncbi:hypothetical protein J6590_081793, partial [Homalodisca vitripennis]
GKCKKGRFGPNFACGISDPSITVIDMSVVSCQICGINNTAVLGILSRPAISCHVTHVTNTLVN